MEDEEFNWRAVWHVRHADGTEEDIVLEHGNYLEDAKGSQGQVLFSLVEPTDYVSEGLRSKPTSNLVVMVQKLAKNVSYFPPGFRKDILVETSRRLVQYRNAEIERSKS